MKKIVIVGGGVSGLSAGIYALESGFDVEIYEKHYMSGGVCTSWSRNGYTFEGAVHWLTASSPSSPMYRIWKEVGVLGEGIKTYRHDPYSVLEFEGQTLCLYRDLDKLKSHFMEISPQDEENITRLIKDIQTFSSMSMPVMDEKGVKVKEKAGMSVKDSLKMLPMMKRVSQLSSITSREYLSVFKHEGLKKLLLSIVPEEYAGMAVVTVMATFCYDGDFPEGGALGLTKRMTDKFTKLGGKLFLSSEVEKVEVKDGKATGIIVKGEKVDADVVIVTRDIMTASNLFDVPLSDKWIKDIIENTVPMMCTFLGIGVKADMSNVPHKFMFKPSRPINCGGKQEEFLDICNYSLHPEYSPDGGTSLTSIIASNTYDWWAKAKQDGRYNEEKQKLAQDVAAALEERFPQLVGAIEIIDVATPLTYERYTGSYKGSWMSGMNNTGASPMMSIPVTCDNIKSMYFAGFRTQAPGGLPVALTSGRRAVQLACKQFDMVFQGADKH